MNGGPLHIACIGEAMIELALEQPRASHAAVSVAGDTFNTAVYLKRELIRRNVEATVSFVSSVGTDAFSERILDLMRSEQLDASALRRDPERLPGLYAIATDAQGERSFSYWRDQSAARQLFQSPDGNDFSALEPCDVLYFSAISLAILPHATREAFLSFVEQFRRRPHTSIAFDSNYRPRLWPSPEAAQHAVSSAWRACDVALPSLDDEMQLFRDADEAALRARLAEYGIRRGALKRGAQGPLSLSPGATEARFEPATAVVDTTAAGDSFNGAYLASVISGASESDALAAGHRCASHVIGYRGAIVPSA